MNRLVLVFLALAGFAQAEGNALGNHHIRADFQDGMLSRLARSDGGDVLQVDSDGFEILSFDGSRYTAKDCAGRSSPDAETDF